MSVRVCVKISMYKDSFCLISRIVIHHPFLALTFFACISHQFNSHTMIHFTQFRASLYIALSSFTHIDQFLPSDCTSLHHFHVFCLFFTLTSTMGDFPDFAEYRILSLNLHKLSIWHLRLCRRMQLNNRNVNNSALHLEWILWNVYTLHSSITKKKSDFRISQVEIYWSMMSTSQLNSCATWILWTSHKRRFSFLSLEKATNLSKTLMNYVRRCYEFSTIDFEWSSSNEEWIFITSFALFWNSPSVGREKSKWVARTRVHETSSRFYSRVWTRSRMLEYDWVYLQ